MKVSEMFMMDGSPQIDPTAWVGGNKNSSRNHEFCDGGELAMLNRTLETSSVVAVTAVVVLTMACRYTPTVPSDVVPLQTQVLEGTVYPEGATPFRLTITQAGTLAVVLTRESPSAVTLSVTVGTPSGHVGCAATSAIQTTANSRVPVSVPVEPGEACLEIADAGFVPQSGTEFSVSVSLTP
jgi:hypothetical protein